MIYLLTFFSTRLFSVLRLKRSCLTCVFLLLFFFIPSSIVFAQLSTIDSLKSLLSSLPPDTLRVRTLNRLAFELRGINPAERERIARQSLKLSRDLDYSSGEAQALAHLGGALWEEGHFTEALGFQERAVMLLSNLNDKVNLAIALNSLGLIHTDQGSYIRALEYLFKSLKIREEINDQRGQQITTSNIGTVYQQQGDDTTAQEYFFKALRIAEMIGDKRGISIALANIGSIYFEQGQLDNALDYNTRSLRLSESIGSSSSSAFVLNKIGLVLAKQGNINKALSYQERAYKTAMQAGNIKVLAHALHGIASANYLLGKSTVALNYAQIALDTARKIGLAQIIKDAAKLISDITASQGSYKEAFQAYQLYKQMSDSAQNLESRKRIANLETSFKLRQQETENQRLQAQFAAQYAEIQQQRTLTLSVSACLGLVILLAIVLARANTNKQRDNSELQRQQHLLEEQAQEIEIANTQLQEQNIALQELNREKNEFLGIAAHDLKNPLSSIILSTQLLRRKEQEIHSEARLQRLGNIENVAVRMQEIITNLLDVNAIESGGINLHFERVSLDKIVHAVVEEYLERALKKNIILHYSALDDVTLFLQADKERLHEILENLVSNAIKYSPPDSHVYITVQFSSNTVSCMVADEGPGLSEDDKRKLFGKFARLSARPTGGEHSTGLGLSIVKKLVEMMHGSIVCESELGKGARFIITFPAADV